MPPLFLPPASTYSSTPAPLESWSISHLKASCDLFLRSYSVSQTLTMSEFDNLLVGLDKGGNYSGFRLLHDGLRGRTSKGASYRRDDISMMSSDKSSAHAVRAVQSLQSRIAGAVKVVTSCTSPQRPKSISITVKGSKTRRRSDPQVRSGAKPVVKVVDVEGGGKAGSSPTAG